MRQLTDKQMALKRWLNHEKNLFVLNQKTEYKNPPIIVKDEAARKEFFQQMEKLKRK